MIPVTSAGLLSFGLLVVGAIMLLVAAAGVTGRQLNVKIGNWPIRTLVGALGFLLLGIGLIGTVREIFLSPNSISTAATPQMESTAIVATEIASQSPEATKSPPTAPTEVAPPISSTSVPRNVSLSESMRNRISSLRVSGGCIYLVGSATSAEDRLRVCEDTPKLEDQWNDRVKQVAVDCLPGSTAVVLEVYADATYVGDKEVFTFCQ